MRVKVDGQRAMERWRCLDGGWGTGEPDWISGIGVSDPGVVVLLSAGQGDGI